MCMDWWNLNERLGSLDRRPGRPFGQDKDIQRALSFFFLSLARQSGL